MRDPSGDAKVTSNRSTRLPKTLHQQLTQLAEGEGVSLNQYIVYALTRQATLPHVVHGCPTGGR